VISYGEKQIAFLVLGVELISFDRIIVEDYE
jgi:hypothetical protein